MKRTARPASWDDCVGRFLASLEGQDRSGHTTGHYRGDLRLFADWWAGTSRLTLAPGSITAGDLARWRVHLREEHLVIADGTPRRRVKQRKPATVNAKLAALKSFLRWAEKAGVVARAPDLPPRARLGRRPVKSLDARQQRKLIASAEADRDPRNLAIVVILIETGLRVAELVALEWRDLELKERKGYFTVRSGKGRKERGPLPLSHDAFKQFRGLRQRDAAADPTGRVFRSQRQDPSGVKKPLTVRGVQELLVRHAARLGWDRLHPHQLRHSFAFNARAKARKPRPLEWPELAVYMGHSSVKTTMDNYATPSGHALEVAMGVDDLDDD